MASATLGAPSQAAPLSSSGYPNGSFLGRLFSSPASGRTGFGGPSYSIPPPSRGSFGGAPAIPANPGISPPGGPASIYPSTTPSTLFPGGVAGGGGFWPGGSGPLSVFRYVRGPRLRHTYLHNGADGTDDLRTNVTDASVAFAFPNFLYSTQPLFVAPSFSLHLWDGPRSTGGPASADLPSSAYEAFLDFGWQSDANRIFGSEFGLRVGAFTDFDTFESESIRVLGKGLLSFRLTPASTLKGGVFYVDRNDIKLIPAGGLLWQPNPFTRFDIFFPQPKLARYWRTVGTNDVWWYLSGDFGGGSWTIERADGSTDSIDINDLRVAFGLEWGRAEAIRAGRRTAFLEIGYVFEREVEYFRNPEDNFEPDSAVMFSAGFGY